MTDRQSSETPLSPDRPGGHGGPPGGSGGPGHPTGKVKHPGGLYVLFFAELWERFSFYGMRALLSLYMKKRLGYTERAAKDVYHAYGALVYAFPVIGGRLADSLLGYRVAILIGGLLMSLGHFAMAIENEPFFYCALGLIAVGNGFFKPNISSLVGRLYEPGDPRRDAGFTIFYMGINIGAGLAPQLCGYLGESAAFGWSYGFGLAGVGMLVGLGCFLLGRAKLEGHGGPPDPQRLTSARYGPLSFLHLILLGALLAVPLAGLGLWKNAYIIYVLYAVGATVIGYLLYVGISTGNVARDRLFLIMILMVFHTTFWAVFEQAGSSFTFLTDKFVNRTFGSIEIQTSRFQSLNPTFIIILAPLFARLWQFLHRVKKNPSIPMKFAFGNVFAAFGFWVLVAGLSLRASGAKIDAIWLVLVYLLHTIGELCLSPVGLSAMTKLSPRRAVGTVMGAWFLTFSFAHELAAVIAGMIFAGGGQISDAAKLARYESVYWQVGLVVAAMGVGLGVLSPWLKRLAHGVE